MSWGKVDDRFPEHRKWAELERLHGAPAWAPAMAVWLAVLCYSNRNETDGEVDEVVLARLTPLGRAALKSADHLVSVALMDKTEHGYRLHNFTEYNPSRAAKEAERQADRARKRKQPREDASGRFQPESADPPVGIQSESGRTPTVPDPTRPDPIRSDQPEGGISELTGGRARPAEAPPGPSESLAVEADALARAVGEAIRARGRSAPPRCANAYDKAWTSLVSFVREEATRSKRTVPQVREALAKGFAADERARSKGYPIGYLAESPGEYLGGHAAVSDFSHVTVSTLDMIPEADR